MTESVTDTPNLIAVYLAPVTRPEVACPALPCSAGSNQSHLAVFIPIAIFRRPSGGGRKAGIVEGRTLHH